MRVQAWRHCVHRNLELRTVATRLVMRWKRVMCPNPTQRVKGTLSDLVTVRSFPGSRFAMHPLLSFSFTLYASVSMLLSIVECTYIHKFTTAVCRQIHAYIYFDEHTHTNTHTHTHTYTHTHTHAHIHVRRGTGRRLALGQHK